MTTIDAEGMCREVDENMGDIIDGIAENAIFDHMAGCERCRDARHDAERAILRLCDAGLDYRVPADLTARLMSALDAGQTSPIVPAAARDELASVQKPIAAREENGAGLLPVPPAEPPALDAAPRARTEAAARPSARWVWLCLAAALGFGLLWFGNRRDPEQ